MDIYFFNVVILALRYFQLYLEQQSWTLHYSSNPTFEVIAFLVVNKKIFKTFTHYA